MRPYFGDVHAEAGAHGYSSSSGGALLVLDLTVPSTLPRRTSLALTQLD